MRCQRIGDPLSCRRRALRAHRRGPRRTSCRQKIGEFARIRYPGADGGFAAPPTRGDAGDEPADDSAKTARSRPMTASATQVCTIMVGGQREARGC